MLPDRAIMGTPSGLLVRVFRPRWWQLWRWLAYYRSGYRLDGVRVLPETRVRLLAVPSLDAEHHEES